ncbi:rRNA pseudouridine synthase, partial [Candidatus Saccharibacteria bacterium]|nr:rRNA pseudouridine synthase [Candidatus Saccharibacteria bacterium]
RVLINGKVATLGNVIQPDRDVITVDSDAVATGPKRYTYVLLNKPVGYVCSHRQQGDTPTIYELVPKHYQNLKAAGRLDKDSCGLVLLTDDGDTIFKLTHPKFGKKKVYHVALNKPLKPEDKDQIEKGIGLEDGTSQFKVELIDPELRTQKMPNLYKVTMYEGRNRQIRRTFGSLRYMVTHLERQSFANFKLDDLGTETYRTVSANQI